MSSRYEEIMKTKPYLPFHMGYLTDQMVTQAEKELGETDEVRGPAIAELRKLVLAEPNLDSPTDDAFLLQYLRPRKFNVKKAFTLLQNYYQVKKAYPEVYDTCDVNYLRTAFHTKGAVCLPYRDENGCPIIMFQINKWDPDEFPLVIALKVMTGVALHCVEDPATQVCGVQILLDVRGASLKQMRSLTPRYIHLFSRALRNCLPIRFKGIHIYNESVIFQYIYSILKLFLSEKIKKRVHFHGDNQKHLHKFIPKAILPSDYGGDYMLSGPGANWYLDTLEKFYEKYAHLHTMGYKN